MIPTKISSIWYKLYLNFKICQSAKLNSTKFAKVINVETGHLYSQVIEKKISFSQWYKFVKDFIEAGK